ncbi:MAG: thiamine phosphate synthase [Pseudanabaenaceae cyanobacterium SKYGB_i_bin29]|nr:thiamine phosphate synthase [Pseudanabaenaceae cyanobacterium SKYG29]MDW8421116.1 thiamine phosphate synthase [Pseudanabaenaceae cyanobacterium SKYGB_i_bin29]
MSHSLAQAQVYRILDANLDRAREGVRVIEEWCRLGLESQDLANQCKAIRQELGRWHTDTIRSARDTAHDPGTGLSHERELTRTNLQGILTANFARVQEALRVLEEYSKLCDGEMATAMKNLRYQVYMLQSALPMAHNRHRLQENYLYLVTMPHPRLPEIVEQCLAGGVRMVQLRDKEGTDRDKYHLAQTLCQLCRKYDALFLVNDRVDLALAVGADGVHLGQLDLPVGVARQILGQEAIIGLSTTKPEELAIALAEQADYVGVGPVFATPTKPGKPAIKDTYLPYAVQNCPIPWFAIGGIDGENLAEVIQGGAQRVAVVRALITASDPKATAEAMLAQLRPQLERL